MSRVSVLILVFLTLCTSVWGQDKEIIHNLKNVYSEYTVFLTESFSSDDIKKRVIQRCKERAIEQVTSEVFKSWSNLSVVNSENSSEALSENKLLSYNVSVRDGEIVEFDIVEEGAKTGEGSITFYCIANVKVKTGIAPDPEFIVPVEGVKSVYMSGDELHFNFTPYKDCYMMLFLIENERVGYRLIPNQYVKEQMYMAHNRYSLNENSRSFVEFAKSPNLDIEYNKLVFLFTLRKWAIDANITSTKEIEEWIARIPNNEKYIHQQLIEIRDK